MALRRALGLQADRFSVAWSRVRTQGPGRVDSVGPDFYAQLVDGLLARGPAALTGGDEEHRA